VEDNGELRLIGIHSSRRAAYSQLSDGVSINSFIAQLDDAIAGQAPSSGAITAVRGGNFHF